MCLCLSRVGCPLDILRSSRSDWKWRLRLRMRERRLWIVNGDRQILLRGRYLGIPTQSDCPHWRIVAQIANAMAENCHFVLSLLYYYTMQGYVISGMCWQPQPCSSYRSHVCIEKGNELFYGKVLHGDNSIMSICATTLPRAWNMCLTPRTVWIL